DLLRALGALSLPGRVPGAPWLETISIGAEHGPVRLETTRDRARAWIDLGNQDERDVTAGRVLVCPRALREALQAIRSDRMPDEIVALVIAGNTLELYAGNRDRVVPALVMPPRGPTPAARHAA